MLNGQARVYDWLDQENRRIYSSPIRGFGTLSIRSELLGGACGASQPLILQLFTLGLQATVTFILDLLNDYIKSTQSLLYTILRYYILASLSFGQNYPQHGRFQLADDHAMRNLIPSRGTRIAPSLTRPLHHAPFNHT